MLRFGAREFNAADLGDAFYNLRHLGTKLLPHPLDGNGCILNHVVQHARGQAHHVQLHVSEYVGYFQRMRYEGLTRNAGLTLMLGGGEFVSSTKQADVLSRARGLDLAGDFFELHHNST